MGKDGHSKGILIELLKLQILTPKGLSYVLTGELSVILFPFDFELFSFICSITFFCFFFGSELD
ncbi:hypothetical protein RchiOBHm_Chr5g0081851 [Rosa chinensis]|uniref:Uncharacterized protein n=1 Tax=Rosa chinensis TaxID=74649 RepID=A0A2P6QN68_ROSCH|nr:hypothetical protein RchiOBHm_Chr5g0081851 [Rosa chinensis]